MASATQVASSSSVKGQELELDMKQAASHAQSADSDVEGAVTSIDGYVENTAAEKKLVRKIDFILLPALWWMYILAYLDRGNISNAYSAGMDEDLNLSSSDYSLIVSIFFIGYTIFEVPSNLILHKVRPSLYLATICAIWGACVAGMSQVDTKAHLLVGRTFLGCIEAGLFPGALFLLTTWYKRSELGKRFSIFYTSGTLAPAFGGILAGAIISSLDGKLGIAGWRWLLLVEGVVTVAFAGFFALFLIDYPLTTKKFFTAEERQLAHNRILHDRAKHSTQNLETKLTSWQAAKAGLGDPRSWVFLILYMIDSTATSISYFIPVTVKAMGYSTVETQWMTVPLWVSGATIMLLLSISSDRTGNRRLHAIIALTLPVITAIICVTVDTFTAKYAMLVFYIGGVYTGVVTILSWASETMSEPEQKRSVVLAFVNSWGNLSIIWGSRMWLSSENPTYQSGFGSIAGICGFGILLAIGVPYIFRLFPQHGVTEAERAGAAGGEVIAK